MRQWILPVTLGEEQPELAGRKFVTAWRQAEAGERFYERELIFSSWKEMFQVLTEKRLQLLRMARRCEGGQMSIRSLAKRVKRDYRNVYADVQILKKSGLLEIREERIRMGYDAITVRIALGGGA
jgi:predicted transcriptional regulator